MQHWKCTNEVLCFNTKKKTQYAIELEILGTRH